ncbi:hypothetical protein BCR33DRAFT_306569 [Rhizoclosmatium globosum]|uniref:Uncharacterized protein n=1 Tax=Rhizoclosmatium globosum TaxID=329046 RepID=A0A1Y2C5D7_9FUNG|nr:hypothetical protein BCR33DRAFT_306569 [Rhizoclosmatium globosum]|eukprot:ORY42248.1 hypothetical protein BCR33DRAFT_306569 [Rhizoclosmatium globosum]
MLPSPTGDGTFALSMKATIDPLSPNLNYFWSLYTDSACTTFLIDQSGNLLSNGKGLNPDTLGVNNAPGCYANHQETVLNYDKSKQSLLTAYTGSDCKTAAKVTVNPTYSNNCTDVPTCTRDPTTGEYYTRSCSSSHLQISLHEPNPFSPTPQNTLRSNNSQTTNASSPSLPKQFFLIRVFQAEVLETL